MEGGNRDTQVFFFFFFFFSLHKASSCSFWGEQKGGWESSRCDGKSEGNVGNLGGNSFKCTCPSSHA